MSRVPPFQGGGRRRFSQAERSPRPAPQAKLQTRPLVQEAAAPGPGGARSLSSRAEVITQVFQTSPATSLHP